MEHERITQVRAKIAEVIELANRTFNITLPNIQIRFDLTGKTAGYAGWARTGGTWTTYYMRFNVPMIMNGSFDHMLNDTVPHEIAHIVCAFAPQLGGRQHNPVWKRVCRMLGGDGKRCHQEDVSFARKNNVKRYQYTTSTGETIVLSMIRHKRIQLGTTYTFKDRRLGKVYKGCEVKLAPAG